MQNPVVHDQPINTIQPRTMYQIIKLRREVFGDEQGIGWAIDLDDRDLERNTRHIWIEIDKKVESYLRLTEESHSTWKLGRVATRMQFRSQGFAGRLNRHAIERLSRKCIITTAEAHLENWYASFDFVPTGSTLVIAGITHIEMRHEP